MTLFLKLAWAIVLHFLKASTTEAVTTPQHTDTWFPVSGQGVDVYVTSTKHTLVGCQAMCSTILPQTPASRLADTSLTSYFSASFPLQGPMTLYWMDVSNSQTALHNDITANKCTMAAGSPSGFNLMSKVSCAVNLNCICQKDRPITTTAPVGATLSTSTTSLRTSSLTVPVYTMNKMTTIIHVYTSHQHRSSSSPPLVSYIVPTSVSSASLAPMSHASPVSAAQVAKYPLERFASTTGNAFPCPLYPVSVFGKAKVCYRLKKIN